MPFIINQKRPYSIYIEEGRGGALAHVAELPGCFATGSTAPLAVAAVPRAIVDFLAWLKRHKEPLVPEAIASRPTMNDISVAEVRSAGATMQAGNRAALFDFDKQAWDDYKVERTHRWLQYSRGDLLARVQGMSEEDLKAHQIKPGRSASNTLWHIANAEYSYINHLVGPLDDAEGITEHTPSDVRERLARTREILVRHTLAIPVDERGSIVLPTWSSKPQEPWTLAIVLRRALEHERKHLTEL
ncbi:MAG: DinB family protein [Chloroflexota bacterium]